MSTNIKTEQEMINELKEINELKDILALFGIDVQEKSVKKKEEPAKKPVQKSETENIYSKAYEAGFNAGIKEGFEKATKTTKNTVEASTAAVRDEMQKKIDVWKTQAEHYHMMAVSAYAFMGTLMKTEPEQLRKIYNMTGNKTEIITKVVDTLSFSEAKKLYDEYIDKCLKPGSMVTDKDGKTAVVITILYSNDHDNRIYFQDLIEILEEMNGPDFYGSMGYAELCVETTLKNYYDIDINNGPVSYDPEVDYRMLLIDLAHELRMGRKNAINVGFEDIAAYYEDIRLRIGYKESDHITNQDFSSQWRPLMTVEEFKKWLFPEKNKD